MTWHLPGLLLERALPAVKPVELAQPIAMPTEGTLTEQGRAVLFRRG